MKDNNGMVDVSQHTPMISNSPNGTSACFTFLSHGLLLRTFF